MLPGLDPCYTYPAHLPTTAGWNLDGLGYESLRHVQYFTPHTWYKVIQDKKKKADLIKSLLFSATTVAAAAEKM